MKNKIKIFYFLMPIILGIAIINLVSSMYAGECLQVDLSELESLDNVVYDVVGNSSSLEGLTIELNDTIANICTVPNYNPDSFTIIFIDNSTNEVIKEVHHYSSGGTRKIYVENKTIEYVDNYIDREIYIDKEIEVKDPGKIKNLEEEISSKNKLNIILITCLFLLFVLIFFILKYIQRLKNSLIKSGRYRNEKTI